jgi:hypothetical protein
MVGGRLFWVAGLSLVTLALPLRTAAQGIGGGIIGRVKDQSGGAVPAALVQLVNTSTGQTRALSSDNEGTFEAREVPPGSYTLTILKGGFNTARIPTVQLGVSQVIHVADITLSVAPVGSETVEVKAAEIALTETSTPARGTSFNQSQIRQLPLLTRDINSFALLAPGVVSVRSFSFASTLVPFAVNGSRSRDINFIIDSVDNNEPLFGGAATQFTNTDAFSEYSVITSQYKAEYGRNSGSVVNIITERGGNQWHGSAFWFGQGDPLNALNLAEQTAGFAHPAHFRGDFAGATLAGPLRQRSTWAFLSYQWSRMRTDMSDIYPQVATIPTLNGLNALSQMPLTSTLAAFLNDPTVSRLALANSPCLGFIPGLPASGPCTVSGPPNNGISVNGVPVEFGTYVVPGGGDFPVRDHQASVRLDHRLTQRDDLSARYLFDDLRSPLTAGSSPLQVGFFDEGLLPSGRDFVAQRTQNAGAFWTHAWPRALHEFRASFSRISSAGGALNLGSQSRGLPALTVSDTFAQQPSNGGTQAGATAFLAAFPAAGNLSTVGKDSNPTTVQSNLYQVQDNFSLSRGRHSLKFGVNLVRTITDIHDTPSDLGQYFYLNTSNSGFQNFAANVPTVAFQQFTNFGGRGGATLPLREFGQSYFAEDDIRWTEKLTVSVGVRYENYGQPINRIADLNPNFTTRVTQDNTNIAPRIGFAWAPGKKTVLRGGYGTYYDRQVFNLALLVWQSGSVSPFVTGAPSNVYPQPPFNPSDALRHVTDCDSLAPSSSGPTLSDCTIQDTISPNLVRPRIHSFSLGLQRQLRETWLFEAAYVGNAGTRLFQRIDVNPHTGYAIQSPCTTPPCATYLPRLNSARDDITMVTNGAHSGYHSLQLSARKRLGEAGPLRRMQVTAAYVWSHMLDNGSEIFGPDVRRINNLRLLRQNAEPFEVITPFAQDPNNSTSGERGNSSLDRRHRASLSFLWALPSPSSSAWTKSVLGGWGLSGIFSAQTGQPFSPLNAFGACADAGGDGNLTNDRPSIGDMKAPVNRIALIKDSNCVDLSQGYIDASLNPIDPATAHFVQVPLGARPGTAFAVGTESFVAGNAGRNILTGPGLTNLDLAVTKEFSFRERFRMQLRFEAYDLTNTHNPGSPIGDAYSTATQAAPALAFTSGTAPITPARVTGVIPENSLDAIDAATSTSLFLSRRFMNTSSRRIQAAVKLVF